MMLVEATRARTVDKLRRAARGAAAGALTGLLLDIMGFAGIAPMRGSAFVFVFLLLGSAAWLSGRQRWFVGLNLLLLVAYFVAMRTPVLGALDRRWIRSDAIGSEPLDAVVVLSTGVTSDTLIGVESADRLLRGLEVLRAFGSPRLLTTRVGKRYDGIVVTSDRDQRRFVELFGAADRWTILDPAYDTHDEALRAAELLKPLNAMRVAVVTTPLHTRRACATFEGAGFQVRCVSAKSRNYAATAPYSDADRELAMRAMMHELVGMVVYPGGHLKFPHPWPGQTPPPGDAGRGCENVTRWRAVSPLGPPLPSGASSCRQTSAGVRDAAGGRVTA